MAQTTDAEPAEEESTEEALSDAELRSDDGQSETDAALTDETDQDSERPVTDQSVGRTDSASVSVTSSTRTAPGLAWKALAAVGVVSLIGAALVAVPWVVTPSLTASQTETVRTLTLVVGALVGVAGLLALYYRDASESTSAEAAVERPTANPELSQDTRWKVAGAELDELLDRIDGQVDVQSGSETYAAYEIRNNLSEFATRVLADATGCTESEARDRVHDGSWTDDPRAAAFLGEDVPEPSLGVRLRDWASGEWFERRVRATVDEIERLTEVRTS